MLTKPLSNKYDSEIPQLVLMPFMTAGSNKVTPNNQTVDVCFRKHAKVNLTAKKLFDLPQSIATLEKYTIRELREDTLLSPMTPFKEVPSIKELTRPEEGTSDRCLYEVRIPILLESEGLLGESMDPASLRILLVLYSFSSQLEWDRLNTCVTVKR